MSFGKMPIANGFLKAEDFDKEQFFNLSVGFCTRCHMVQLTELIEPSKLFHENYAYFSSISSRMMIHFKDFAQSVIQNHLAECINPLVIEIGSNDGIMLKHFAESGFRHIGVEPSANVAKAANDKGVNTVCQFFNEDLAIDICRNYGRATVILGANVVCHLPDMHSILKGIKKLLTDDGLFIFEEPYLGDIIQKASFDQIYDEHVFYFSLHSLKHLFEMYEMEIIEVAPQNVHGGSMRYTVAQRGKRKTVPIVHEYLDKEEHLGLLMQPTYDRFRERISRSRDELVALLKDIRAHGKRVTGYGATSKSTTVTNYCDIGTDLIESISDTTPGKLGKYSPGVHIPILSYTTFRENYPDYALLFAWNHSEEIVENEKDFREQGGKFIIYVPEVAVI
jgi:methylation protein EvaC